MSRMWLVLGLILGAQVPVMADAKYVVDSDVEADVYLDGKRVGDTPITLTRIPAGAHRLEIRDPRTRKSVVEEITSPEGFTVEKVVYQPFRSGGRRAQARSRIHRSLDRERLRRDCDDDDDGDGVLLGAALLGGAVGVGRRGYWGGGYPYYGGVYPYYGYPRRGLSVSFGFGGGFGGYGYPYAPGYWY